LDTIRLEVGYQAALPALRIDGQDNDVDSARGTDLAIAVPGQLAGARFTVGTMAYLPDQAVTRLRNQPAQRPRWALYDHLPQRTGSGGKAAVGFGDRLSLGGGVSFMSATQGVVRLRGLVGFPRPEQSELDLSIDVDLKTVRYPVAGAWYRALPWLDLGASYRGGFVLPIDLALRLSGDIGAPGS